MQQAVPQTLWLDVAGMHLCCLTAGENGSPVVLLHGAGLDSAQLSWEEVIGPLAEQHCVFAPDLPGYGRSSRPDVAYTIDFYTAVVTQILDHLHLDKVSLVGLSMGGAIALSLALAHPERIEKLVLVDTFGIQDKVTAQRFSYLFVHLPLLNQLSYWLMGKSRSLVRQSLLAALIYNPAHLSDALVDQVYQAAREKDAGKAFISLQKSEVLWSGLHSNFTARLREITAPTLLIHGAQDRSVPLKWAQRAHSLIPHSQLTIMQECRHWPQRENPREFNHVIGDFLI